MDLPTIVPTTCQHLTQCFGSVGPNREKKQKDNSKDTSENKSNTQLENIEHKKTLKLNKE